MADVGPSGEAAERLGSGIEVQVAREAAVEAWSLDEVPEVEDAAESEGAAAAVEDVAEVEVEDPGRRFASARLLADWLTAEVEGFDRGPTADAASAAAAPTALRGAWRMFDPASGGIDGRDLEFERLAAWAGAHEVPVAVIDSGADWDHPVFDDNRPEPGSAALPPDAGALYDHHGHGTHVAGIATYGTDRIQLVPLGFGGLAEVSTAVAAAKAAGARVVNMSFNVIAEEADGLRALAAANPDLLFVQSAGNSPKNLDGDRSTGLERLMGHEPNAILVANRTPAGPLASDSAFGRATVLLAARGTDVVSAAPGGEYDTLSGTSMAAPFVSNVAAKLISLCPSLTPAEVREVIAFSVERTESLGEKVLTRGTIHPERAYRVAALLGQADRGEDLEQAVDALPGGPLDPSERIRLLDLARLVRPALERNTGDEA